MMAPRLPRIGEWYEHLHENDLLRVLDTNLDRETVTVQRLDGNLEEIDLDEWNGMPLESIDPPDDEVDAEDDVQIDELEEPELSLDEEGLSGPEESDEYD